MGLLVWFCVGVTHFFIMHLSLSALDMLYFSGTHLMSCIEKFPLFLYTIFRVRWESSSFGCRPASPGSSVRDSMRPKLNLYCQGGFSSSLL